MRNLAIFDGNSIINRAYYAIRNMTFNGQPTNALFGYVNTLLKHLERSGREYDYAAVAFDLPDKTFRHEACADYKATRRGMPDDLAIQLPYAKQITAALGISVIECKGFEADDILGTLSRIATREGLHTYLVTGDRDSYQLVNDDVTLLYEGQSGVTLVDRAKILELYGIEPPMLIDLKAIMGDSSDNIKGVAGIGEKGALELIRAYKSLDGVYDNLPSIKESLRRKLEASRDMAYTSRFLAEINCDAPISHNLTDYTLDQKDHVELARLFKQFGFSKMLSELEGAAPQTAVVEPHGITSDLSADKLYIFAECDRFHVYDGKNAFYLLYDDDFDFSGKRLVLWDLKLFLKQLMQRGASLDFTADDLSLAAYIVSENGGEMTLAAVTREFFGVISLPSFVSEMPRLERILFQKLEETQCFALYRDIELPLTYVLAECEFYGFAADKQGLEEYSAQLEGSLAEIEECIYSLGGERFNILSPKQLGVVLFEKLMLPTRKKNKSGYSTDVEVLESLVDYHPIVAQILAYRKLQKLKSTYADGLLKVISPDGRIRTTFRQTLTNTGRLSSVEPNLQNIPVRTEMGRVFRKFFVAKSGYSLIDADYSQIELRILAHISNDKWMLDAFREGIDIHTRTASQIFHVAPEAVTSEMRKRAKAVNFGIVYGIGEFSLSKDIGVSRVEAAHYITKYLQTYQQAAEYLEYIKAYAHTTGYVATLFGRRRYIPELKLKNKQLIAFGERVAMNAPIQGTAADIIKKAMVDAADAYKKQGLDARNVLQIHDELIVEARDDIVDIAAEILKNSMENAVKLNVPLTVDIGIGKSWYDAKN